MLMNVSFRAERKMGNLSAHQAMTFSDLAEFPAVTRSVRVHVQLEGGGTEEKQQQQQEQKPNGWSEHMLLYVGIRPVFAMRGLSSAVCLMHGVRPHSVDAAYRHVGSSRRGSLPHTACTFTRHTRRSRAFSWQGYQRKKMGLQGGRLSADSAFPPSCDSLGSLLNQGLAVCLFGW